MLKAPAQHCKCGANEHTVPMPIRGRVRSIDFCISDIVAALNAANITTAASCCGHGRFPGSVLLDEADRHIIICTKAAFDELFIYWGSKNT